MVKGDRETFFILTFGFTQLFVKGVFVEGCDRVLTLALPDS